MEYFLNPAVFSSAFSLPSRIVDDYLTLASQTEIKVILYFFRHMSDDFQKGECSKILGISISDVEDALYFWANNGVLLSDNKKENTTVSEKPKIVEQNAKPTRIDVAKRGLEDENVAFILRHAQQKFGRNLKTNESSTLLYIYDDLGFDVSLVLFLLEYALNEDKLNIRFIEKTAVSWGNAGVSSVSDAERIISEKIKVDLAWKRTEKAFGIEHRKPSAKEQKYANIWFNDWMLDDEVLVIAYEVCVNAKSKFIFEYCAKTIDNWKKQELVTPEQIKKSIEKPNENQSNSKNSDKYSYAGYNLELYEKMLNSDD